MEGTKWYFILHVARAAIAELGYHQQKKRLQSHQHLLASHHWDIWGIK